MKILHITPRYLPAIGGAEQLLAEQSRRFVAGGHEVTVVTSDALDFEYLWDPTKRRISERSAVIDGVQILRFPVQHLPLAPTSYHAVRRLLWLTGLTGFSRMAPKLKGLDGFLDKEGASFDLLGGMNIAYEGVLQCGLNAAKKHKRPFVVCPLTHLGAGDRPGGDSQSQFYTMPHQQRLVQASTALIAQTETEAKFYADRGFPLEQITVSGPGIDPQTVQGGDGDAWRHAHGVHGPLVACICTLSRDKGIPELVEAFKRLSSENVTLALAGRITAELEPLLKSLNDQNILILGQISHEEKCDLLAACDVFSMPSRIDSFGIAYLEAWANKKPVVAAESWGAADVISVGHDGLLAPFGDVAALAEKLDYLIKN
ncbi:MAG: glycogen(starch) synthase, partial [Candidatus Promineifilaceae bacterium]